MRNLFVLLRYSFLFLAILLACNVNLVNAQVLSTVAGQGGCGYNADGIPATAAQLAIPTSTAMDAAGNIYVADFGNFRVRKISTSGIISTIAGNGIDSTTGDGGQATAAAIGQAIGVAIDASGQLYISCFDCARIRKVDASGIISTIAGTGTPGFGGDGGPATAALLNYPRNMIVDHSGNILFSDVSNRRVRKINTSGIITTIAGNGTSGDAGDGGPATNAQFNHLSGIAANNAGEVFIADLFNERVRKINTSGIISNFAGSTWGFSGDGGPATAAKFYQPEGLAFDAGGNLYIADFGNHRVRKVNVSGIVTTVAGSAGIEGYYGDGMAATAAKLFYPEGVMVDTGRNIYISDFQNSRIRKVDTSGAISTVAGIGHPGYAGDGGPATTAEMFYPLSVAHDRRGNMYFSEEMYPRVRKVTASGIITTIAGTGIFGYTGDGGPATAADIGEPWAVQTDTIGNIYVADASYSHVRKIDTFGIITTIAGQGTSTADGIPATAAALNGTVGMALDNMGNIYVTELYNNKIRKINAAGIISTVAGNGTAGFSGDGGPATAAQLDQPWNIAVDAAGNLYICDFNNNRIRKVSITGIISTVVGTGSIGFAGDGGAATAALIFYPGGIYFDATGNLLFCDQGNNRIRKVTAGIISTIFGSDIPGYTGDGGPATAGRCNYPVALSSDTSGNLYVAESTNNLIRKISSCALPSAGRILGKDSLCSNAWLAFTATISGGTWLSSNTGVATVSPSGIVTGVAPGIDTVMYIVSNSCGSDTAFFIVVIHYNTGCNTGVSGLSIADHGFQVYPNPNHGSFSINLRSALNEPAAITVTDILGQKVRELKVDTNKPTDIILNVAPGIYFISATATRERYTAKIVVE